MIDRSAQPSSFGWQFQIVTAISLAINNINEATSINVEGPLQDIEITLSNNHIIFGQAKSYAEIDAEETNNTGWNEKLSSAITGLFEDFLKQQKNSEFKYLVNYPYPLGKNKGGKTNFHTNEYGDILGTELTERQVKILYDILHNSKDKDISELSSNEFNSSFEQFLKQLSIRTCRFTNISGDRRFSKLDLLIKDFLDTNHFNTSVKKLRQYWFNQGFANSSQKFALSRTEFLFAIVLVDNVLSKTDLFGRRYNPQKINQIYDRFVDIIEHTISMEEFNRQLVADILDYFRLEDIVDYYYSDEDAEKFTDTYLDNYLPYFKLNNLSESDQRLLTRFALARCLEEQELMSRLFNKGAIKNAN
ncbi:hypothetical protein ACFP3T_00770 [Lactiplantibacillus dongliensis]|uniref:CD-NTase associated protein 4-like DNA endonuclease domain-containing protein n=1 Tax=Lactiplantibacillus dongliensis TaxID=2559919 RepID=A0ABW1R1H9_9LACO|nr:hypothetical protein [Lactiplantibacillus dongliensis]